MKEPTQDRNHSNTQSVSTASYFQVTNMRGHTRDKAIQGHQVQQKLLCSKCLEETWRTIQIQKPFKFQKPSGVQGGVRWLLLLGLPTLSFTGPVPFLPVSLFLFPYTYTTVVLYAYVFSYPTKRFKEALMYPHWRETIQVHKVWQKLLTIKSFIDTWEDPHRRKTILVHKVWQELLTISSFEGTYPIRWFQET